MRTKHFASLMIALSASFVMIEGAYSKESLVVIMKLRSWNSDNTASAVRIIENSVNKTGYIEGFEDGKKVQLSTGLIVATFPYNRNLETYTAEGLDTHISFINNLSEIYPRARGLTQIKDDLVAHKSLLSSKSPERSPSDFNLKPKFDNDDTHRNEIDHLDRFETAEGTIFTDIFSINSDPGGITIMHAGGVARVAYAELTQEQRAQFKLSKEGADLYAEREKDERNRREKQEQARIQNKIDSDKLSEAETGRDLQKKTRVTIEGAIVKEQGIIFGIIVVKKSAMRNSVIAAQTRATFQRALAEFSDIPLILASQDSRGVFEYQGRSDIVAFLASIEASRIPWKRYTYNL